MCFYYFFILFIFIYSGNMLHYAPENKCTTKIFININGAQNLCISLRAFHGKIMVFITSC